MAFIISKTSMFWGEPRKLFYLVQNYREGKKIKRKTLVQLRESSNLSMALQRVQEQQKILANKIIQAESRLESIKRGDYKSFYPGVPYRQVARAMEYIEGYKKELQECQTMEARLVELINTFPGCSTKKV